MVELMKSAEGSDGTKTVTTRRGLTVTQKLIAGLSGVVLAGTLSTCGPNGEPVPTPEVPKPTPSETEQTYEQLVASIEIEAGLDDQALATAYVDQQSNWWNAGKNPAIATADERFSFPSDLEYIADIAQEDNKAYIEALYTADNTAGDYIQAAINIHNETLVNYMITIADDQPFERTSTLVSVEPVGSGDGTRTLRITYEGNTNDPSQAVNGEQLTYDITFVTVDGKEKISNAVFVK